MVRPIPTGRNQGKYCGDSIDIDVLQCSVAEEAARYGWLKHVYYFTDDRELCYLTRTSGVPQKRIYVSCGIHGDEPAGPHSILELLRRNLWPEDSEVYLFPCLNPTGFRSNSRENVEGIDLNRDYRRPRAPETRAHIDLLDRLPEFDLMLCLHEDWEASGFYLYELNPANRPSPAEALVARVARHCPIDLSESIDGRIAAKGIIRPDLDPGLRPEWPESFYLILNKTLWSYTLEAPSDFELPVRVAALTTAVLHLLEEV